MNQEREMRFDGLTSRRQLLEIAGLGFGTLALTYLLEQEGLAGAMVAQAESTSYNDLKLRPGHFKGAAKSVIQLVQPGGPSQMDLFDPKPELTKRRGQPHPGQVETVMTEKNRNILLASPFKFIRYGECAMELAEIIPHMGSVADELCLIRSMYTAHNNHQEGLNMLQTCKIFPGRPTMGAWVSYALGTENQNLPAYVVLRDPAGYSQNGRMLWSSGFLPATFQGVEFNSEGSPVHHLSSGSPLPPGAQRHNLDLLATINSLHKQAHPRESELEARIQNYELAARMQLATGEVLDLAKESTETRKLYGLDHADPKTAGYGKRCLMARRLVEAGVRFVQVYPPGGVQPWDHHAKIEPGLRSMCGYTDQAFGALVRDLKRRGLLESTVIMWAGEFGRLPITENADGRDHNRNAFSLVLAGGGFKKGIVYGETDEFGYKAISNRVGVPDLHATVLHLLGISHERLIYPHHGVPETPTDARLNHAKVVSDVLESRAGVA